jgi:hypothetical protein
VQKEKVDKVFNFQEKIASPLTKKKDITIQSYYMMVFCYFLVFPDLSHVICKVKSIGHNLEMKSKALRAFASATHPLEN